MTSNHHRIESLEADALPWWLVSIQADQLSVIQKYGSSLMEMKPVLIGAAAEMEAESCGRDGAAGPQYIILNTNEMKETLKWNPIK